MVKFHTDQAVPSTGIYHFAGHIENRSCQPAENEKRVEIVAGEIFHLAYTAKLVHFGKSNCKHLDKL